MEKLNSYDLSRNWFDFCFENPELISPNHSAIYFFAIEHCNRLGWKEKFGFPTQMAMDAIGIKKHQTYIKYFEDICNWGFFKLVQKSKNQYSSNIISLISAMPKKGKALDKAITKHEAKQTESNGQSNSSILKQETIKQGTIKLITWRENFEKYIEELNIGVNLLLQDAEWISEREKFHPNLDIKLSIEKAYKDFWGTEGGWKHKKKSKSDTINWKTTFNNAIELNKVYKSR